MYLDWPNEIRFTPPGSGIFDGLDDRFFYGVFCNNSYNLLKVQALSLMLVLSQHVFCVATSLDRVF